MVVKPVILTKGTCKLAIYGIGNIKDERLHEVFPSIHCCSCSLATSSEEVLYGSFFEQGGSQMSHEDLVLEWCS